MSPRAMFALALLLVAVPAGSAEAAARGGSWRGQATSTDRDTKYGKVSFRVSGSKITRFTLRGVPVPDCGGTKVVVVFKLRIRGTKFSGRASDEATGDVAVVRGTISGGRARGTFSTGPKCGAKGRFTARAVG